jgi:hypothetical protein
MAAIVMGKVKILVITIQGIAMGEEKIWLQ